MKMRLPDSIHIYSEEKSAAFPGNTAHSWGDAALQLSTSGDRLSVTLCAEKTPLSYIRLRWSFAAEEQRRDVRILGDEWERGYGHMEWRGILPERCMPWVCLVSNGSDAYRDTAGRLTEGFGIAARPACLAFWQYDGAGITAFLDVRNGGRGVVLSGRTLRVCDIVFGEYRDVSAMEAAMRFYKALFPERLPLPHPVYGGNTWYYSYGDISQEGVLEAGALMAKLCRGLEKPYMVIDDGWSPNRTDGPWDRGNAHFPDMAALAERFKDMGLRPGIWFRPLCDIAHQTKGIPEEARLSRDKNVLDPSHPAVQALIRKDVHRFAWEWGYELIKHDFTNCDVFGAWGFARPTSMTDDGWAFYDRGRTSAEIVSELYRLIYEAAQGKALILGCNTAGHLIAGYAQLNRTGDDTSGRDWERTRRYGVNTLAFRQPHAAFFMPDADCVGIRGDIPWARNRQWLKAVSVSGTPLFISLKPGVSAPEELSEIREALKRASVQNDTLIPLDWMENTCPARWLLNGDEVRFDWYGEAGCESFKP